MLENRLNSQANKENQATSQIHTLSIDNVSMVNKLLTEEITYTITTFVHVPFPQHINSKSATQDKYTKAIEIGSNTLTVTYENSDGVLPSGIYPRRFFSWICQSIIKKRSTTATIKLPKSRSEFIKTVLNVNYDCGTEDKKLINQQLKSFTKCKITIIFSNPNSGARKDRNQITILDGDYSWLFDEDQPWQNKITISDEMFHLISRSRVPISEHAVTTFTNTRKLDVFNYFTYQNYNLYIKKLNYHFEIDKLFQLFGGGIAHIYEFRRTFNKIIADITSCSNLEIKATGKHKYELISNKGIFAHPPESVKSQTLISHKYRSWHI